jgi:hypothetical protein
MKGYLLASFPTSSLRVLKLKFTKKLSERPTVIPAKAGIQKFLIFLDSGSR